MSSPVDLEQEVHRIGNEYGCELAAALVLASSSGSADRAHKWRMTQIVLDQIEGSAQALKAGRIPDGLIQIFQRAARNGVRKELLMSGAIGSSAVNA
jgi:ABC-type branched-subunit amino acid transport system substrate-binding protein